MNNSEISKRFTKPTLLDIAMEELGIEAVTPKTHVLKVIRSIRDDLETNGIPDDEVSDELFDLLIVMEFIDEEGNVIEAEPEQEAEQDEQEAAQDLPDKLPKCWGWGDPEDPACTDCPFIETCIARRLENQAKKTCFGLVCDEEDENCQMCIIWKFCLQRFQELEKEQAT